MGRRIFDISKKNLVECGLLREFRNFGGCVYKGNLYLFVGLYGFYWVFIEKIGKIFKNVFFCGVGSEEWKVIALKV